MKRSKIFALYLPQYYETPENNEWWGKGYTDWEALKKSGPCFKGHKMPRIPLNQNYYSLDDPDTIRRQAKLAKQYGVDGFCIYHYFSGGKLQMEKPAELLLANSDIDISYFFSWANHDFRKLWFNGNGELLRKQVYGNSDEWTEHFNYLLKFFCDMRYLKIDNKPVLCIYDFMHIKQFDEMMSVWNTLAKKNGFSGLYIIATKSNTNFDSNFALQSKWIEKVFVFEPMNYRSNGTNGSFYYVTARRAKTVIKRLFNLVFKNHLSHESYDSRKVYEAILNRTTLNGELYGIFTDWDNTPRYPGNSIVFKKSSPELFRKYFSAVYKKSCREEKELLFINAWNEWGESAYLEPDTMNEFVYLETIRENVRK